MAVAVLKQMLSIYDCRKKRYLEIGRHRMWKGSSIQRGELVCPKWIFINCMYPRSLLFHSLTYLTSCLFLFPPSPPSAVQSQESSLGKWVYTDCGVFPKCAKHFICSLSSAELLCPVDLHSKDEFKVELKCISDQPDFVLGKHWVLSYIYKG